METYWNGFIEEYSKEIPNTSLMVILEAYYHWCRATQQARDQCDKIMRT